MSKVSGRAKPYEAANSTDSPVARSAARPDCLRPRTRRRGRSHKPRGGGLEPGPLPAAAPPIPDLDRYRKAMHDLIVQAVANWIEVEMEREETGDR